MDLCKEKAIDGWKVKWILCKEKGIDGWKVKGLYVGRKKLMDGR